MIYYLFKNYHVYQPALIKIHYNPEFISFDYFGSCSHYLIESNEEINEWALLEKLKGTDITALKFSTILEWPKNAAYFDKELQLWVPIKERF